MLELVDSMLDDIDSVSITKPETVEAPAEFAFASKVLEVLQERFDDDDLPTDRRRLAETIVKWITAINLTPQELAALLDSHRSFVNAVSLDPTSAVLAAILTEHADGLLESFDGKLVITAELESLCPSVQHVPSSRRVRLTRSTC